MGFFAYSAGNEGVGTGDFEHKREFTGLVILESLGDLDHQLARLLVETRRIITLCHYFSAFTRSALSVVGHQYLSM